MVFIRFTNSPFYTQHFINWILKIYNDYCRVFIDDIIIFSNIFNDYIEHLENFFFLFRKKNININLEKFYIRYPIVELLRYYIDTLKIYFIKNRIQSFYKLEFPSILKTLKDLSKSYKLLTFYNSLLYSNRKCSIKT